MRVFHPKPAHGEQPAIEPQTRCSECGSVRHFRDYARAEVICRDCGLVLEERMVDLGPEWRGLGTEERMVREHTGPPMTYTICDKGLSAMIDPRDYDAAGSPLKPEARAEMRRLRKWDRRARISGYVERNLSHALSELDRAAAQLELPQNVRESASVIYRRTVEKGLTRGYRGDRSKQVQGYFRVSQSGRGGLTRAGLARLAAGRKRGSRQRDRPVASCPARPFRLALLPQPTMMVATCLRFCFSEGYNGSPLRILSSGM